MAQEKRIKIESENGPYYIFLEKKGLFGQWKAKNNLWKKKTDGTEGYYLSKFCHVDLEN